MNLTPNGIADREAELMEKAKTTSLSKAELDEMAYSRHVKERKELDRIVHGVNDTWVKEYDIKELDLKFKISIKAPKVADQGRIQALLERYLDGVGSLVSQYVFTVYHTLATIRVCGIDVPIELQDDERIYNTNILFRIGNDFAEWLDTFRY